MRVSAIATGLVLIALAAGRSFSQSAPTMYVDTDDIVFADRIMEETEETRTIQIENVGTATLVLDTLYTTDINFRVGAYPKTIEPSGKVTIDVTFAPVEAGVFYALVVIRGNDPANPEYLVHLRGRGLLNGPPYISVSPSEMTQTQDARQVFSKNIQIRNVGGGTLEWSGSVSPAATQWLGMSKYSGSVLTASSEYPRAVFTSGDLPTGEYEGTITLTSNDELVPTVDIPVTMHVRGFSYIELSSTFLTFGETAVGDSDTVGVVVNNTGGDPLVLGALTGVDPQFHFGDHPGTVAGGESFPLDVIFSPTHTGTFSSALFVDSNARNGSRSIFVEAQSVDATGGTGVAVVLDPTIDFGAVPFSSEALRELRITNTGSAALGVVSVRADDPGAFGVSGGSFSILPGATRAATILYHPGHIAADATTVRVIAYNGAYDTLTVGVTGVGVAGVPTMVVDTDTIEVQLDTGESTTRTLDIGNSGWPDLEWNAATSGSPVVSVNPAGGALPSTGIVTTTITLDAGARPTGDIHGSVTITSNAPATPTLVIPVTIHVVGTAIISVTPAPLVLDDTGVRERETLVLTVTNPGVDPLILDDVFTTADGFSVDPRVGSVQAGGTLDFDVVFSPPAVGSWSADAVFVSNAVSVDTLRVPLSGRGTTPAKTALYPNQPNPFNPTTNIRYDLRDAARVELVIYGVDGARVRTLASESKPAGRYEKTWDGTDDRGARAASGVYFYRLRAGSFEQTRKMVLLK